MAEDAVIVGGGPSGLAAAIELQAARGGVGDGDRARARGRRHPPPQRPHRLRRPRPAPGDVRARATPRATASWPEQAGVEVVPETMVTDWQGKGTLWLTGPSGRRRIRPAADRAGHGLPRAAALGAPGPGHARPRRDDDEHAAAARLPARPARHRRARGGRRRRARQLLGRRHPRPRRRLDPGAGDRAAAPPVAGGLPSRRARPLPGARLDAQPCDGDQRRRATASRRWR